MKQSGREGKTYMINLLMSNSAVIL